MIEEAMTLDYFEDAVLSTLLAWPGARIQHFFFEGKPIPLARQRSAIIRPTFGKPRVVAFSPKQNKDTKARIYSAFLTERPVRFTPPYTIALKFICEPLKTVREEYPTSSSHGDLDNLSKLCFDAIFDEKVAIPCYKDDRHIINALIFKRLPAAGEKTGIHFWMVKP